MKQAILTYEPSGKLVQNLGDYIQSLAAKQFFMGDLDYLCREHLDTYNGEPTKIILNGWFMHHPENFPPSGAIDPLFISYHISPTKKTSLLTNKTINYLKKHGPIGCRDMFTLNTFQEVGIPSYFSGCLTLTLGETYIRDADSNQVYFVDPYFDIRPSKYTLSILCKAFHNPKKIWNIAKKIKKANWKYAHYLPLVCVFYYAMIFYQTYSHLFDDTVLLSSTYLSHHILLSKFDSEQQKFKYAETFLKYYMNATYIVTSRIHCALPALGIGTPTLFVTHANLEHGKDGGRFTGLIEHLNVIEYDTSGELKLLDDCTEEKNKFTTKTIIRNKESYLPLKELMIQRCKSFLNSLPPKTV